jgi:CPA2 family monovalent cation:H+ antiporter-2
LGHEVELPFLREALAFLIATVVLVPLFHRLKTSPVFGYLVAGTLIGPHGLGLVEHVDAVTALAQLGIVFLMFTIGLEVSPDRLRAMRRYVFGFGAAQVALSAMIIGVIAWAWGNSADVSLLLGGCLALSSTAIVLQLLVERGELASRFGRATFSVLLFQDLAVVPILFMINVFGNPDGHGLLIGFGLALGRAAIAIVGVVVVGRLVLRPLFRVAARTAGSEVFIATALLVIIGIAVLTEVSGLSMAMGAFLAGLLIAETEFRHQIEIDILPFKGLLLGLFFMSVGMGIDFAAVADVALWVAASVVGLIAIKAVLAGGLARVFGLGIGESLRAGLLLGPSGEFAFIVIGAALTLELMPAAIGQFMLIVAGLSMLCVPLLDVVGNRAVETLRVRGIAAASPDVGAETGDLSGHVIIAGFGRVGRVVARFLDAQHVSYVAFDVNTDLVANRRNRGHPVFFGDASRADILDRAGLDRAAAVVVALKGPAQSIRVVEQIRARHGEIPIFVRTHDAAPADELLARGANHVIPETMESSLQLGGLVLQTLGTPREAVDELIDHIRAAEYGDFKIAETKKIGAKG